MTIKRIENVLAGSGVVREERVSMYVAKTPRGSGDGSSPENAMGWEELMTSGKTYRDVNFYCMEGVLKRKTR